MTAAICPKCGSAAVMAPRVRGQPVGRTLQCQRCHHIGRTEHFKQWTLPEVDWSDSHARRSGAYMPSRTIPLSDEDGS
jgi:hypothetical protein